MASNYDLDSDSHPPPPKTRKLDDAAKYLILTGPKSGHVYNQLQNTSSDVPYASMC